MSEATLLDEVLGFSATLLPMIAPVRGEITIRLDPSAAEQTVPGVSFEANSRVARLAQAIGGQLVLVLVWRDGKEDTFVRDGGPAVAEETVTLLRRFFYEPQS